MRRFFQRVSANREDYWWLPLAFFVIWMQTDIGHPWVTVVGVGVPIAYQLWCMQGLQRGIAQLTESSERSSKLLAQSRYVEIPEPIFSRPLWEDRLKAAEEELHALGFQRLLYFHNATFAAEFWPNFRAVYVSGDRTIAFSLYFGMWLDRDSNLMGLSSRGCVTAYPGSRWVETIREKGRNGVRLSRFTGDQPIDFTENHYPVAATIREIVASHQRYIRALPWSDETCVPWDSPESYLAYVTEEHRRHGELFRSRQVEMENKRAILGWGKKT